MKLRAGLVLIAGMALMSPGLALAGDNGSDTASSKTSHEAMSLPDAPMPATTSSASPFAINPVTPSLAQRGVHGFPSFLKGAVTPQAGTPAERKTWMALSLATHGAAAFDAYSTRASLQSGHGYERNPIMAPFAHSAMIYPATQVAPLGFDYLSRRMMSSNHSLLRHMWWLPQLASATGSTWAGVRNLHVAQ